jgi:hypothetical protein
MYPAGCPPLGKEVICPATVDQSVQVIDPTLLVALKVQLVDGPLSGSEVKLWPQRLMVKESFTHR